MLGSILQAHCTTPARTIAMASRAPPTERFPDFRLGIGRALHLQLQRKLLSVEEAAPLRRVVVDLAQLQSMEYGHSEIGAVKVDLEIRSIARTRHVRCTTSALIAS